MSKSPSLPLAPVGITPRSKSTRRRDRLNSTRERRYLKQLADFRAASPAHAERCVAYPSTPPLEPEHTKELATEPTSTVAHAPSPPISMPPGLRKVLDRARALIERDRAPPPMSPGLRRVLDELKEKMSRSGFKRRAKAKAEDSPPVHPPCWERASPVIKSVYGAKVLDKEGRAFKFDLRLDEATLLKARAHGKGRNDFLRRRLDRLLKAELGHVPEYLFVVESHAWDEFARAKARKVQEHLHGVVALDEGQVEAAKRALMGASSFEASRRLVVERVEDPVAIGKYSTKFAERERDASGGSGLSITRSLSRRARELYEAERSEHLERLAALRPASAPGPVRGE